LEKGLKTGIKGLKIYKKRVKNWIKSKKRVKDTHFFENYLNITWLNIDMNSI